MKYKENAVGAKVHALFAKCLTDADYENLLSFHTYDEIFNYLRNETAYSEYLGALPSVSLSRSRFESVLRKVSVDRESSICRFQKLIGDKSYKYFIKKDEIETIIYCARHLDTAIITDLFERPPVYKSEQSISGQELQKATSFEEFVNMLIPSPYGKLVEPLNSSEYAFRSLSALERILYNNFYLEIEPLKLACQHFVNCCATGHKARSDGENGYTVVSILEEAEKLMLGAKVEELNNKDFALSRMKV